MLRGCNFVSLLLLCNTTTSGTTLNNRAQTVQDMVVESQMAQVRRSTQCYTVSVVNASDRPLCVSRVHSLLIASDLASSLGTLLHLLSLCTIIYTGTLIMFYSLTRRPDLIGHGRGALVPYASTVSFEFGHAASSAAGCRVHDRRLQAHGINLPLQLLGGGAPAGRLLLGGSHLLLGGGRLEEQWGRGNIGGEATFERARCGPRPSGGSPRRILGTHVITPACHPSEERESLPFLDLVRHDTMCRMAAGSRVLTQGPGSHRGMSPHVPLR